LFGYSVFSSYINGSKSLHMIQGMAQCDAQYVTLCTPPDLPGYMRYVFKFSASHRSLHVRYSLKYSPFCDDK